LQYLSFFSGAMGLDLGLEESGLELAYACEIDKNCKATIAANRPEIPLASDITTLSAADVRSLAGLNSSSNIELVVGGPPCQSFSTAGSRRGLEDSRGNVLLKYVELIGELQPEYAVLENVRGLLSAPLKHIPHADRDGDFGQKPEETRGGVLSIILKMLADFGYSTSFNLYNAANFGAPQSRERVIILCHKGRQPLPYLVPTHSQNGEYNLPAWKTFRSAVEGLPETQEHLEFPENRLRFYRMLKPGQYWKDLPTIELQMEALGASYFAGGGKTGFFRRLAWDKPSPTLVTHPAMPATDLAHPELDRPLSLDEYKRIQGFPDSWRLEGNLISRYRQVGNAVPIPLGRAVGEAIARHSSGIHALPPQGFKYSRYLRTSSETWIDPLRDREASFQGSLDLDSNYSAAA
jgi:DNA (cytosine-5)-methyltransferase 1